MQPGLRWGPFTARIPFVHLKPEGPELLQGLLVTGATGLAVVPLFAEHFGMSFETAVAMVVVQSLIVHSAFLLFGEPFCPGWLTPALPLVLRAASSFEAGAAQTDFVNATLLAVAAVFLFFGVSGLGRRFLNYVPRVMKAAIILGAGLSAVYSEFIPRSGGRPSRVDAYTVAILAALGVSLVLMYSAPLERWKQRWPWLRTLAGLGIAPGYVVGLIVGWAAGEISYQAFVNYSGPLLFWPDFGGLLAGFSVLGRGLPPGDLVLQALPLALAAYVIGFGDMVTGTAILEDAARDRPDEQIPFDPRRTHLAIGLRNGMATLFGGPFFALHGPIWTGATVVVAERYRRGRSEMESIFSGNASYYLLGFPVVYFVGPLLELMRPGLDTAFSLTLLLTGFACGYVALAMLEDRLERGVAVLTAMTILYFSILTGLAIGFALTALLIGRKAWLR